MKAGIAKILFVYTYISKNNHMRCVQKITDSSFILS